MAHEMFLQGDSKSVLQSFARQNAALVQSIADLGMCHGDMHCENVAVQDKKLILIDFVHVSRNQIPYVRYFAIYASVFPEFDRIFEYVEENKCSKEFVWICDREPCPISFGASTDLSLLCALLQQIQREILDNDFATKADQESLIDLGRKAANLAHKFHEKGLSPTKALKLANEG